MGEGSHESRSMGLEVERDPHRTRLVVDRWVGAVVEEGDLPVRQHAAVVLPCRRHARAQLEGALQATESPQDPAAAAFELITRPGAARRDE
jgi:hypothetical protein